VASFSARATGQGLVGLARPCRASHGEDDAENQSQQGDDECDPVHLLNSTDPTHEPPRTDGQVTSTFTRLVVVRRSVPVFTID
jgi:hypothetical protein